MRTFDCGKCEEIVIDKKIVVRVVELADDEVYLEIAAPEDVSVSLKETLDAVM